MPLIDLKTKLKDLKYGVAAFDRRGGGWSGQPYIEFPITEEDAPSRTRQFYELNRNGLDFPIRGGSSTIQLGSRTVTLSAEIDKTRIKKFLQDKPKGDAFIKKQIGLQLTNPKTETGTALNLFGQRIEGYGILENTRLYNNGLNTLEQVGFSGTGIHIQRQGLVPIDTTSKYYAKTVGSQLSMTLDRQIVENRLLLLQQLKLVSKDQIVRTGAVLSGINKINQLGLSLDRSIIQNYLGGPSSVYGLGNTTIRRYEDTTKTNIEGLDTYDQLYVKETRGASARMRSIQNLQIKKAAYLGTGTYDKKDLIDYRFYTYEGNIKDIVNVKDSVSLNSGDPWTNGDASDDLIKFGFECMSNDTIGSSMFLQFRAFLTNGLTDNHQAAINSFKYIGRGEDFFIYEGFSRVMNFSFRIAAQSKDELLPLYNKLNNLASQVYPDYSSNGIMRSSLVKVTIGDYLYRVPGFLESVNITIGNDASWDIDNGRQLPIHLDVSISFKPIHSMLPKRSMLKGDKELDTEETIIANQTLKKYKEALNPNSTRSQDSATLAASLSGVESAINSNRNLVLNSIINAANVVSLSNAPEQYEISKIKSEINRELRPQ